MTSSVCFFCLPILSSEFKAKHASLRQFIGSWGRCAELRACQGYTNWIAHLVDLPGRSSSLIIIYFYDESHIYKVFQAPNPYINLNSFGGRRTFSPFSHSSHSPFCKVLRCWHRVASEIHTEAAQRWRGEANMSTHMWFTSTNSKIFSPHTVFFSFGFVLITWCKGCVSWIWYF